MNLKTVILLLAAGYGSAAAAGRTVLEPSITSFEHSTWAKGARVTAEDTIDVTFVVKGCPMKRAQLEEKFWAVSDPKNKDTYKKYLSLAEVADMLHPIPAEGSKDILRADAITQALNEVAGLIHEGTAPKVTLTRDLVTATLNAQAAEAFFGTELFHFTPSGLDLAGVFAGLDLVRAASEYSLPDSLAANVAIVEKLVRLPKLVMPLAEEIAPSTEGGGMIGLAKPQGDDAFNSCDTELCKEATTPAVLKQRYGFPTLNTSTAGNSMACTEFQLQGIIQSDLDAFKSTCGVAHVAVDTTEGSGGSLIAGVEALLDVEYIEAVAAPIPLTVINSISYSLFDWSENLNNDPNAAWVQSVSYGNDEIQQTSVEYMNECNAQFQMNGARGLSVLFASGDQGVWGRTGRTTDDVFHPDFPGDSPYITTVGGTEFLTKSVIGEETTWADGGGGFSNVFAQPSYQADAVNGYFASGVALPEPNQYNATGRAYPDVAALAGQANGYCVAAKGKFLKVGGTSAACPVFAGAIAMLNDHLLSTGGAPMGFLNPWIYSVAAPGGAFFDVTSGTNNAGVGAGFTATTGWDPATGFGTPNYKAMLSLV